MRESGESTDLGLLTQTEAAAMLRMSETWLEHQRSRRQGLPYIKLGKRVFYDKKDIVSWLGRQKIKH